ncbi:unnamed protein product [Rotaria socialis]|uniref:Uncharacterized protein n=1 Tax=Rotaria socialis TaxID=392032 RepID=A0A821JF39_9BILA|nr:unnamed protein product [Rotaria socialis]CAF4601901.1 unnamed protein product [Rotaria socialis]CAF4720989.1 unnamed protein product [Rotaria socialis]CAF4777515.1 unnamed protein product [Rotaria socialis]
MPQGEKNERISNAFETDERIRNAFDSGRTFITGLPHLTELKVMYDQLKLVTMNVTSDAARCNCSKVKRLFLENSNRLSKDIVNIFHHCKFNPMLSISIEVNLRENHNGIKTNP